jgi:hypothetical protein
LQLAFVKNAHALDGFVGCVLDKAAMWLAIFPLPQPNPTWPLVVAARFATINDPPVAGLACIT